MVEEFLKDPLGIRVRDEEKGVATVQVKVPKVAPPPTPPPPLPLPSSLAQSVVVPAVGDVVVVDDEAAAASAQAKRAALQRKAAAAMVAAEDYARRFESGDLMVRFFEFGPLNLRNCNFYFVR